MTDRTADWIAIEQTANALQIWVMQGDTVLAQLIHDQPVQSGQFETVLLSLISPYLGDHAICLVARDGAAAPSIPVPCTPYHTHPLPTHDPRLTIHILPNIHQPNPADILPCENARVAGYLSQDPKFDGVLCLTGNHTRWLHISAEEIVSFRSFMTAELANLLAEQSVLQATAQGAIDPAAFDDAAHATLSRPQILAAELLGLRAHVSMGSLTTAQAQGRLWGLLVGAELAGSRPYWLGQRVVLIGSDPLNALYMRALQIMGVTPEIADTTGLALHGFSHIKNKI